MASDRHQQIADEIEDAQVACARHRHLTIWGKTLGLGGLACVIGEIMFAGIAATLTLGMAPVAISTIVAGALSAIAGVAIWLVANGPIVFDDDDHPADELRRLQRRQRDFYLEDAS